MDHFDESDEKNLIEVQLAAEVLNSSSFILHSNQRESSETLENLLQGENTKLVLQSKNPYSKLAFIKALKDNLICLGYLEETVDTLNYFHEDLINSAITTINNSGGGAAATASSNKKRKALTRKKSHDKTNIYGEKVEVYEVNIMTRTFLSISILILNTLIKIKPEHGNIGDNQQQHDNNRSK